MSELTVNVLPVREIKAHPNPEVLRLEIALIEGWECIVAKGSLKTDDKVVYFPIDSLLPMELENRVFGDAKIRLNGKKVKTINIKGAYSQGLAVPLNKFPEYVDAPVGYDLTQELGVQKWEPTVELPKNLQTKGKMTSKKETNPHFYKYTDLQHLRKYYWWFAETDEVVATEKIHGTSARYANLPTVTDTLWKKVKKFFGLLPEYEFCYGSRNVQLQSRWLKKAAIFSDLPGDVYTKVLKQYELNEKLASGEAVYGEIVGHGIQTGYAYGHKENEVTFYVYDVKKDGRWLDHDELKEWCSQKGLLMVPELYRGPFSMAVLAKHTRGPSTICDAGAQPVREGLVLRTTKETVAPDGNSRKMSKWVSEEYLFRNQENGTDFH